MREDSGTEIVYSPTGNKKRLVIRKEDMDRSSDSNEPGRKHRKGLHSDSENCSSDTDDSLLSPATRVQHILSNDSGGYESETGGDADEQDSIVRGEEFNGYASVKYSGSEGIWNCDWEISEEAALEGRFSGESDWNSDWESSEERAPDAHSNAESCSYSFWESLQEIEGRSKKVHTSPDATNESCDGGGALSMIGVPPAPTFWGKFLIFQAVFSSGIVALSVFVTLVLIVSTILNAMYFLPIIYNTFFSKPSKNFFVKKTPIFLVLPPVITAV
jgi:hypothetical protein